MWKEFISNNVSSLYINKWSIWLYCFDFFTLTLDGHHSKRVFQGRWFWWRMPGCCGSPHNLQQCWTPSCQGDFCGGRSHGCHAGSCVRDAEKEQLRAISITLWSLDIAVSIGLMDNCYTEMYTLMNFGGDIKQKKWKRKDKDGPNDLWYQPGAKLKWGWSKLSPPLR